MLILNKEKCNFIDISVWILENFMYMSSWNNKWFELLDININDRKCTTALRCSFYTEIIKTYHIEE